MVGFRRDATGAALLGGRRLATLLGELGISTPAYVYDLDAIALAGRELRDAFRFVPTLVAYAVKANTAGSILRRLAAEGLGADVVSGAELMVARRAGVDPGRIVMSGVAKTDAELDLAIATRIHAIQAESVEEVERIGARARATGHGARIALRLNPGVAIDAHAHVATGHDEAKFGIARADLHAALECARRTPELSVVGLSMHVGSMLREPGPWVAAGRVLAEAARALLAQGVALEYLDLGGGFGIDYGGAPCEPPRVFADAARALLGEHELTGLGLVIEPGRAVVAPHGVLLARVVQTKRSGERRWVMIDAGMNDLIRPALYAAHHRIEPAERPPGDLRWRVVGPVCESSDDFGEHPLGDQPNGTLVIRDAGAYGFVMASEYNGRALPAEVFLSAGTEPHVSPGGDLQAWIERRLGA